jgi:hypothetical protein
MSVVRGADTLTSVADPVIRPFAPAWIRTTFVPLSGS